MQAGRINAIIPHRNLSREGIISVKMANVIPKKQLGQNFITDPTVCPRMVEACGIDENWGVIEIGPGLGALTLPLADSAGKVVAIELDTSLIPQLREKLGDRDNVEIINADVMECDIAEIIEEKFGGMPVAVMGNLPYYITSPIIMMLLQKGLKIKLIAAMVQKEAGIRLCAPEGSRESGAVTLAVRYYSSPKRLFDVSAGCFWPVPGVDSTVIRLDMLDEPSVECSDPDALFRVIRAAFSQRRKTVSNSISAGLGADKSAVTEALKSAGIDPAARAERLTLRDHVAIMGALREKGVQV